MKIKKLTGRKKYEFENPIKNLSALFKFISREIDSDTITFFEDRTMFTKKNESLLVEITKEVIGSEVVEILVIKKEWNDNTCETITYENRYENHTVFIARELIALLADVKSSPDMLSDVNKVQIAAGEPVFISPEVFAANINFVQMPESFLKYESNSISRSLQTLASLCMRSSRSLSDPGESFIKGIFDYLQNDENVQSELIRRFGAHNEKAHLKMLRLGKLQCCKSLRIEYTERDHDAPSPSCLGYIIKDICKIYSGQSTAGRHAEFHKHDRASSTDIFS